MTRPFLPTELPKADPLQEWRRALLARAFVSAVPDRTIHGAVARLWPDNAALADRITQRAMSQPASLTDWGKPLVGQAGADFVRTLRPRSAAARLFDAANRAAPENAATVTLPRMASDFPVPAFVGEGQPIPVVQAGFAGVTLGPPRKMAMITTMTGDLHVQAAGDAELTFRLAMDDAAARGLDAAVFSNAAASDLRPAGLLNGVTPLAATAGGGVPALVGDAKKIVGAIVAAGGGADIALYMNPEQAVAMSIYAASFAYPIIPAPSLAVGTIVGIEQAAIASMFPALPNVDVSGDAVLHMDTDPRHVVTAGALAAGARVQSAWQANLLALRMVLPCAWTTLLPGAVQVINGATW